MKQRVWNRRIRIFFLCTGGRRPGQCFASLRFLSVERLHRTRGSDEGSKPPVPRKESTGLSSTLLGAGVRLGLWGSATDGPAGRMTEALVAPYDFPPVCLGPDSLGHAVGCSQHPLGGNEGSCTDVCAIGPHTDHPRPPPSHGLRIPEGGVPFIGEAAG